MPFPDELARGLSVVPYNPGWPGEFALLASRIKAALGPVATAVDHTGSTSVPGLAAKDCLDVQVRVGTLDEGSIVSGFGRIGFRVRDEWWNRSERTAGGQWPKLVFAPPVGERASNVHVRESTSETARRNLLFRDFLRANDSARDAWAGFKQRLAQVAADIYEYGQVKVGPTEILMMAAENWAAATGWTFP